MLAKSRILVFLTILPFSLAGPGKAQEMHQHEHSSNEKLGRIDFPVSCTPGAQAEFNRAVAMLHSFWYEKAVESFREVARRDASCAMAYWGVAMSLYYPLWERPNTEVLKSGWAAVEKARAIGAKTDRERDYIASIEAFYKNYAEIDHLSRVLAYEKAMEQLHRRYPADREAGVFYSLALLASAQALPSDKSYIREKKAAGILNEILSKDPQHPGVVHYLIHSCDSPPLANLALNAARSYAQIAPSVPHALHMPSHIFTRLGLWQESVKSNIASESAAKSFAVEAHMDGAWDEQLHAMDYLMYAYLQGAQDKKAKATLDELYRIQKVSPENFKVAYAFAAISARYAIERRQWSEAASLKQYPAGLAWNRFPWAEAIMYFTRAVGSARSGDLDSARRGIDKLSAIENDLVAAKDQYWATQVRIQRLAASAWVACADGKKEDALKLMQSAADLEDSTEKHPVTPGPIVPSREMLGDMLLELREPGQALKEFEKSLLASPNRFGGLLGAARAARLSGNMEKAGALYAKLVTISSRADSRLVEVREAKAGSQKESSSHRTPRGRGSQRE